MGYTCDLRSESQSKEGGDLSISNCKTLLPPFVLEDHEEGPATAAPKS